MDLDDEHPYEPGVFAALHNTDQGRSLWRMLNGTAAVTRMEAASDLGRPAAEAVGETLLEELGEWILEDRVKQMAGHMIRQIMERRGYVIDQQNVKIVVGPPFSRATRYVRRGERTYHVFRARDPRQVALTDSRSAETVIPSPEDGSTWRYDRSFVGELRGVVGFGVPDFRKAREDIARQGYHLYRQERMLRAANA